MALPVYVDAYSGYRADERPSRFELDGISYPIDAIEDRWCSQSGFYFKVRCGKSQYILHYNQTEAEWTLQSACDGAALYCRAEIELIVVGEDGIRRAEGAIETCEHCNPAGAETPFDWILDQVSGHDGRKTDYFLARSAVCPNCRRPVTEKTYVESRGEE